MSDKLLFPLKNIFSNYINEGTNKPKHVVGIAADCMTQNYQMYQSGVKCSITHFSMEMSQLENCFCVLAFVFLRRMMQ